MTAAIEGAERELKVARRRIGRGIAALVAVALVIGGLLIYPFYEFVALIGLACWRWPASSSAESSVA